MCFSPRDSYSGKRSPHGLFEIYDNTIFSAFLVVKQGIELSRRYGRETRVSESPSFKQTLGPLMIWGLGVGYVISGLYFGWNLGLVHGGSFGLLIATFFVTILYVSFVLSYAELSCAMPKAGGAFVYVTHGLGPRLGFIGGVAQIVEFVFAPPAIAAAIGAYFNLLFPHLPVFGIALIAYLLFTALNIYGVRQSALFELIITIFAVVEILIFAGVTLPSFSWEAFSKNPLPNAGWGIFASIPYAIWFYLAIEGIANVAEESRNPQRDISVGFISAIATLVVLVVIVFFSAVGVNGWEGIVYKPGSQETSDSPLPLAMGHLIGQNHFWYHLLVAIGLFGLIASFHGIILAAGRATFEFGRVGYVPKIIGTTLPRRKTPAAALILNMGIGLIALFTGRTGEIIMISVFGALTLYIISLITLFQLRKKEPSLPRPFRVPGYPLVPAIALFLAVISLASLIYFNVKIALIYLVLLFTAYLWFSFFVPDEAKGLMRESDAVALLEKPSLAEGAK